MKVKNLHKLQDWENYYSDNIPLQVKLKAGLFTSYDIFLCDSILEKYIPRYNGQLKSQPTICEIGSGNGKLVKKIAELLGYKPYGIEYSKEAAEISKKNGVDVFVGDAFDKKVANKFKNRFDAVFSYGFVEHIIPPEKAIKLHLSLVKPGGYFIIQIPRFKGFNFLRLKFFRPDLLKNHNLDIMNEDVLEKLCRLPNVKKIYCRNYGTFKLRLPMDKKNFKYYLLKGICSLDYILNPMLRLLFGSKGFETNFFSPSVMFIGKRKAKMKISPDKK